MTGLSGKVGKFAGLKVGKLGGLIVGNPCETQTFMHKEFLKVHFPLFTFRSPLFHGYLLAV
jgi:hypothetical protein